MINKIKQNKTNFSILGIILLTIFSFYYTDKIVDLVKSKDPIMKEIMYHKENYIVAPINATINDNYIIPGLSGLNVNIKSSYNRMKELGYYNDKLYVYDIILPEISINDNYDKYIIQGNKNKKEIALIFKFNASDNINKILDILNSNKIKANFFIDGKVGEDNIELLIKIINSGNYLGNLGYNNEYDKKTIKYTNALINKISTNKDIYCYSENSDIEILSICSKLQMHTIKPFVVSNTFPFISLKQNLENGMIFSLDNNEYTLNELDSIIKLIKQKGFSIVNLEELLKEKN